MGDELDALTRIAEMRTILARAGRRDLADLAWARLCPRDVPLQVRHNALTMAGYPFLGPLVRSPEAAKVLQAAANLYGEQEWFPLADPDTRLMALDLVGMGLFEQDAGTGPTRKYRVTRPGRLAALELGTPS